MYLPGPSKLQLQLLPKRAFFKGPLGLQPIRQLTKDGYVSNIEISLSTYSQYMYFFYLDTFETWEDFLNQKNVLKA